MLILKDIAGSFVNEPKRLKLFVISKIGEKGTKQTHGYQQQYYQQVTAVFGLILEKNEWITSSLLRIGNRAARPDGDEDGIRQGELL